MMRWPICAAALLATLLSSCSVPSSSIAELMEAPKLSDEQAAVNNALEAALGSSFTLKYPRSGDYRSAFVFYDIDRDDIDEALAFYQLDPQDRFTNITVLDKSDGVWHSICTARSPNDVEIDSVRFESVESTEYKNIIISWQQAGSSNRQMNIYTYVNKNLELPYTQLYADSMIRDFNEDGLIEIMLISKRRSNPYRISYISWDGMKISETDSISLGDSIVNGFSHLLYGRLPDGRQALFVDVGLYNAQYGTEIITLESEKLTPQIHLAALTPDDISQAREMLDAMEPNQLVTAADPEDKEAVILQNAANAIATMRTEDIPCADFNNDGIVEIPSSRPMLGYEAFNMDEPGIEDLKFSEIKYLTTFSALTDGIITPIMNACVNLSAGYLVRIPDKWLGKVTIYSENDLNQWQFFKYTGSLTDLSTEVLRIRRISKNDFQDRFETNPILLNGSPTGLYQFYGYLPDSGDPELAITQEELLDMFMMLPQ